MTDKDRKFLSEFETRLQARKEEVKAARDLLEQTQENYTNLYTEYIQAYKISIARRFMETWNKSGQFPQDDELVQVVFYLSGSVELESIPKINIKFDSVNCEIHLSYFNERLKEWKELKP